MASQHIEIRTPLAQDALLIYSVNASEELGRLFRYDCELLSLDPEIKIESVLGMDMTLSVHMKDGDPRHFNGFVARFGQAGTLGRYTRYFCTLRPFLWFLTRTSDSRIFQGKTVPEIVKDVLMAHNFTDIEEKLEHGYEPREYCVQYRETDFDFVSRLLEEEGIYYFFRHEEKKHKLVLADSPSSHYTVSGYEKLPYIPPEVNAQPREEHFRAWTLAQEVQSGAFAVNDFDFEVPRASLLSSLSRPLSHARSSLEQYDPLAHFVGAHDVKDGHSGDPGAARRAEAWARVRLEELQADHDRAFGESTARGLALGALFELENHPRGDQNREYVVQAAHYNMRVPGYDAGGADASDEPTYTVSITAHPSKVPFRPRRVTPRPTIPGVHSAIVVGSSGEEIWTDKYARVKVQFPWDRNAGGDDTSSCWVRVSQAWAGGAWGGLHVPRVGQEVLVEFIEGDPDRPIITGRVYNGANAPPFGMPANATQSGILSRSSKGGGTDNANEVRLEDKKGEEQLFLHAEKNMDTEVENDQTLWVGHDRHKKVDNDQTEEIKGNKTIHVVKAHKETIDSTMTLKVAKDEDETFGANRTIEVTGTHDETIHGAQGVTVDKDGTWSVGGNGSIGFSGTGTFSVGKKLTQDVGADMALSVGDNLTAGVGKKLALTVDKAATISIGDALSLTVAKDAQASVDGAAKVTIAKELGIKAKEIKVEAETKIVLKAGDATITLDNGKIEIKGSKIQLKSDGDLILKGSKIGQN